MLENDYTPKPVYYAYQFITSELRYADYVRQVNNYPGLRIYEFFIPGKQIWVAWSADFLEHTITLSDQVLNIYDKYGNPITPTNNQITIISPVFIEFTP